MAFRVIAPTSNSVVRALWADLSFTADSFPAEAVGFSYATLKARARMLGLPPRPIHRDVVGGQMFRAMWVAGVSAAEMGRHFGRDRSVIVRAAARLGLSPRGRAWKRAPVTLQAFLETRLRLAMQARIAAERQIERAA